MRWCFGLRSSCPFRLIQSCTSRTDPVLLAEVTSKESSEAQSRSISWILHNKKIYQRNQNTPGQILTSQWNKAIFVISPIEGNFLLANTTRPDGFLPKGIIFWTNSSHSTTVAFNLSCEVVHNGRMSEI